MTKKREPLDLVGRLATRLDVNAPEPAAEEPPPPPVTVGLRAGAPVPREPRIVGRQPPVRIEPTFARRTAAARAERMDGARLDGARFDGGRVETQIGDPLHHAETTPIARTEAPPAPSSVDGAPAATAIDAPTAETVHVPEATLPEPMGDRFADRMIVAPEPGVDGAPALAAVDAVDRYTETPDRKHVELNLVRLQKEGFLTPQNQRSLIAEEYRIIKRPLLRSAFDHVHDPSNLNHVIMVTSARPEEGKTFTAINLAMSVATERDLFVLLVDCDIRRMGLSKKLGVADRKGLMDVLMDPQLSIGDVILRTNIPNLAVIPSGQPIEAATEVFASANMTALVDDLATRYPDRFIIFDAPPVLASSEPGVLAVHVGQTVMVVHANETSKRAIAQSIPLINGCPNVHFVLNRVTHAAGPDRFGYYGTY